MAEMTLARPSEIEFPQLAAAARGPAAWRRASVRLGALFGALLCLGLVMVASAAGATGSEAGSLGQAVTKRLAWMALGAGAFAVGFAVPHQRWRRHHLALAAAAFGLLALVLVPGIGARINGARRWIRFGTLVGVQPSEFAKIALVIWLAACCERHLSGRRRGPGLQRPVSLFGGFLLPAGVVGLASFLVLCEPDFGTAVLIAALGIGMLVVCGAPLLYVTLACVAAVPLLQKLVLDSPERLERIAVFVNPWSDPQGSGYQLIQSLIAVGSGGTLGKGLGLGVQKMGFLPAASNDFIFAIICEELGFVGAAAVVCLYVWLLCEGLRVALRSRDTFGFALALGITALIGLQALVNIAVVFFLAFADWPVLRELRAMKAVRQYILRRFPRPATPGR